MPTRRTLIKAALAAPVLATPGLIGRARAAATLRISTSYPNDPKFAAGRIYYDLLVKYLAPATDNAVTTQFFPDNQLGQEADIANQVKLGVVDIMLTGSSIWTNLVPEFGAFDLGYVFIDYDHMMRASTTKAAADLQALLVQKAGAHFPTWGRNVGERNFMTKFAFQDPAGLSGKKIRSLPNPVVTETVRLMGAAATPMAFGEIYTALQAGVLDGLEHDAPTCLSSKFYETAKNYTLTQHILGPFGAFVSDKTLTKMKPELRDGLLKAIAQASADWNLRAAQITADAIEGLKAQGVTVATCDRAVFRARMQPLWDSFTAKTPGAKPLLDAFQATAKA